MRLHFLGANRQVTGSRYLLEAGGMRIMVDCGLFQEWKHLERNWDPSVVEPSAIDVMLLTHAHLDHCGCLPRLVANGFNKSVYCTEPTTDLAGIVMMDSAHIQEEDAKYKVKRHRKHNYQPPRPVEPLYTAEHAKKASGLLKSIRYDQPIQLNSNVSATFHEAGHILGSAAITVEVTEGDNTRRVLFSGDIGQWDKPLVRDPAYVAGADYVILESTYGDRNHPEFGDVESQLERIINETHDRGGNIVIPTFAIERAQELMYYFGNLVRADRIPDIPIYLDSPMAVDVTQVFKNYTHYLDRDANALFDDGHAPLHYQGLKLVRSVEGSMAINNAKGCNVIMSSSGMCTGGRIKHHLKYNIGRHDSTILFVGYQAQGTLGRQILEGNPMVRIHGRQWPVNAKIEQIFGFSAHGDQDDLLHWCSRFTQQPRHVFLTHGDEQVALSLADAIHEKFNWHVSVPEYRDHVELD